MDSLETPHEALSRSKKLVVLLNLGGFKLTKFISNTPHLLDEIENNDHLCQPKVILVSDEEASSHVLGLKWDHRKDTLVVSRGTKCDESNKVTQRLVLSLVAKVFDPIVGRAIHGYCSTIVERHLETEWPKLGQHPAH